MSTPIYIQNWKPTGLVSPSCMVRIAVTVLMALGMNQRAYSQVLYIDGEPIYNTDSIMAKYLQLSNRQKLNGNIYENCEAYLRLGKYADGYCLVVTVESDNDYPDVDTTQCRSAILYGKDREVRLERLKGKSVYAYKDDKRIGIDNYVRPPQAGEFMRCEYFIVYNIEDIDDFLDMDISGYSLMDGNVSYQFAKGSKQQRTFNKNLNAERKYTDFWYDRRSKLSGMDNDLLNFIFLGR